jgi:indolepyruvate ferredoxin oxidoreductase
MAYKDEYEVARLHLRPEVRESIRAELGEVEVRYQIHPPILRALGLRRKLSLGTWIEGPFRLLVALRRLRGTALDPFGYARVRRVERALVDEYRGMVERALVGLGPESHERAVRIACLPDVVRGYEEVKLRNLQRFREAARALGA